MGPKQRAKKQRPPRPKRQQPSAPQEQPNPTTAGGTTHAERETVSPIPSFKLKLDWAKHHIENLRQVTDAWPRTDAYGFIPETNPNTGRTVVRANIRKPPPPELTLIVGDAVHALRASLDHLALQLAIAFAHPKVIPSELEETSEFVIVGDTDELRGAHRFDRAAGTKLRGIDPGARDVIKALQPYHRKDGYAEDPLWVIHELDRIDKHRRLNLTAYAMGGVGINPPPSGSGYIEYLHLERVGHTGPVEHGTVVATFTARNASFQMNFARQITLAEPSLPKAVFAVQTLADLRDYVENQVLPSLTLYLGSRPGGDSEAPSS